MNVYIYREISTLSVNISVSLEFKRNMIYFPIVAAGI